MEILFWTSAAAIGYAYLGYGLLAWGLAGLRRRARHPAATATLPDGACPRVAFVIPACNEADVIAAKVIDTLSLDYPRDRLQVIVVTDGSDDGTADLVARIPGILHLHEAVRRGKAAAMNRAVGHAGPADIVCFSDANTRVRPRSLRHMAAAFADPSVGAVSGEKQVIRDADSPVSGESAYWRYESAMKRLDARLHSAVGAAGELFCVRRALAEPIPDDTLLDDLHVSLAVCRKGYRIAYEPAAVAEEPPSLDLGDETRRKVRIAAGAFQTILRFRALLLPWPYPVTAFQLVSRRVFRWVVCPLAIPLLLIANLALAMSPAPHGFYLLTLTGQSAFHALALLGWHRARRGLRSAALLHLPFYFDFMHACMWAGFVRFIRGRQQVTWHRARRR
jgi:cellulose synthase/poly-beta-1,6-N-acetylglucosamine synthase-like glycosyltransferase